MKAIKILILSLLLSTVLFAQNKEVNISIRKLTDNIYMLKGRGGNIGISIGADGVFMIDDQYAPLTPKILDAIKTLTDKPVKFLINTHWHGDHTGGNLNMDKQGAIIVAQDNVYKRMSVNQFVRGKKKEASPKEALPVISFSEDLHFYFNDEAIYIFHVHNAHTDGDAMVYFPKANVLHMGDVYFQGKYPFIDLNSGGSIDGVIKAVEMALLLIDDDTKVIPGHQNDSDKKELTAYYNMLKDIRQAVKDEINKGKTLAEVKQNTALTAKYDASYGTWFIKPDAFRETLYKSLTQKNVQ
jgi:cyclase